MTRYEVKLTDVALVAISQQARYIAAEQQQPQNAERWLQGVWDAVDSLEQLPTRAPLAAENDEVDYEVRHLIVGGSALLFTIDDTRDTVWVIALRGTGQLPRTLPDAPPGS